MPYHPKYGYSPSACTLRIKGGYAFVSRRKRYFHNFIKVGDFPEQGEL
jgi:hypothetical protein